MKCTVFLSLVSLAAPAFAQELREPVSTETPGPHTLRAVKIAGGMDKVTDLRQPPGDSERLFVTSSKRGIYIIKNGELLDERFLDLQTELNAAQGLMSLAFHPDYQNNGRFFILYMDIDEQTHLVEYSVSADPDLADPGSRKQLLGPFPQPGVVHNWNCLQFGPDGMLYVSTGDGVLSSDAVTNNAQDLNSILGKMLRLDINAAPPYIPPDNPFVGVPNTRGEIWYYGLRQPWRFCFDPANDDMFLADVGGGQREELNFIPAGSGGGLNFGWRCMEGTLCRNFSGCNPMCNDPSWQEPIHEFTHTDFRCVIIGGYVYRGEAMPWLHGTYFFGDHCSGRIWSLRYDGTQILEFTERSAELEPEGASFELLTSFGVDNEGELYFLDRVDGEVFKIVPGLECAATSYCATTPNSVGPGAVLSANDSFSVSENAFELGASGAPANQIGIYLYGPSQVGVPFGNGTRCVGGSLFRLLPPAQLDAQGNNTYAVDFTAPPIPEAEISFGSRMNFQLWYRDPAAGGANFNASDAVSVSFCP